MSEFADQIENAPTTTTNLGAQVSSARGSRRASELVLVVGFVLIMASVPVVQTCLELARHEHVQFTDVFRYRPTAKNLRQYEETLKDKSWFQQKLRPLVQRLLYITLRDTGAKGVLGRDHWLFYRPDLRYLLEPDRPETGSSDSKWVRPPASATRRDSIVHAITRFRDQLQERGITLVVVPVPGKPSVYPDQVTRRGTAAPPDFRSPTFTLIELLRTKGVVTVDLFSLFQKQRAAAQERLWLAQDTHWTPYGAWLAAGAVATKLRQLNMTPAPTHEFRTQGIQVDRWGDILDMLQIPGLRRAFSPERVVCEQVLDPNLGPLVPTTSERPGTYRYPGQKASVLVLGDSFARIYQYPEPQSLGELVAETGHNLTGQGEGKKRLLPGSAGFVSQLALALKSPIDSIVSDGGASTDVRHKLSTNPEILEGKKIVIWEFVERDIALGAQGWEDVPLPARLN